MEPIYDELVWDPYNDIAQKRLKALEERVLGTCPKCGNEKLKFDGKNYRCVICKYVYS